MRASSRAVVLIAVLGIGWFGMASLAAQARGSFIEAVRAGDVRTVRVQLQAGADVNAAQADGMTPLHWAAVQGDAAMVRLLLSAGADVQPVTRLGGFTPLLMAAQQGDTPVIEALLAAAADPNLTNANGTTALMLAAGSGQASAVTALLARGAAIDATEKTRGQTALMFAAAAGRVEVLKALTAKGAALALTTRVVDVAAISRDGDAAGAPAPRQPSQAGAPAPPPPPVRAPQIPGRDRRYLYNELVGTEGGTTALLLATRQGHAAAVQVLLDAGADVNQPSAGDGSTALLVATINGHFDLALALLSRGADATATAANGVTPLYAVINCQWAQKALYPQPRAYEQQRATYLDVMTALLDRGADPNARVKMKVWYSGYNSDFSAIDEEGATPFWRAAYASDVDAMRLLVARGADPNIPTSNTPGRARSGGGLSNEFKDVSGHPPVPVGGPAMTALHAAAGPGYGEGFAGNAHRVAPGGMLAAVRYLVGELGADVNAVDAAGNTPLHNAAARGDNDMIRYLLAHGADPLAINREGRTTVDMANGPVQRVQPFPDTIALLESLGAKKTQKCVSC